MSELRGYDAWRTRDPSDDYRSEAYRDSPPLNCHQCGSHSDGSEIKDAEGRWRPTCADCYRELRFGGAK